ncbi:hypothetical protein [Photorhabdus namnaonensis]|uniref:Uncharacterized protein n=1 Tax=Photorhabdus namnaonensis TaxID=1851568 RepID=A0A1B8YGR6_9GAMM|nr:hypothetical protein [Photorhabdus namnaonensis]OCA54235.1 hypothetical protein Phpb_02679 [Photorhabdus namnaonensis]
MKTKITLTQFEFNEIISGLPKSYRSSFNVHRSTYVNDKIALEHFIADILCDYTFDLANEVAINVKGE